MISIRRWAIAGVPLVYLFYLPVPSLFTPNIFDRPLELAALAAYLVLGSISLLLFSGLRIPMWLAILNLLFAVFAPLIIIWQRSLCNQEDIGGWLVMGVGVVLTATAVRQHRWLALIGLVSLLAEMMINYGLIAFASQGLAGAIVFVLAGLGVSSGLQRATQESDKYREQQAKSLASIAAIEAAQTARQARLKQVLGSAIPMLEKIAQTSSPLTPELKSDAKLLELALRDEIRGKGLMTESVRAEVARLRKLGVEVALLDEGGIDDLTEVERDQLLARAVSELQVVDSGRVTIRSPRNESFNLTVVATLPGQAAPVLNIKL